MVISAGQREGTLSNVTHLPPSNEVFPDDFKTPFKISILSYWAKGLLVHFHSVVLCLHGWWPSKARKMEGVWLRMAQNKTTTRCLTRVNIYWVLPPCQNLDWTFHISHVSLMSAAWWPKLSIPTGQTWMFTSSLPYLGSSLSRSSCPWRRVGAAFLLVTFFWTNVLKYNLHTTQFN